MGQQRISYAKIAFSILKINGVDLVWHCRAAYLASLDTLTEVVHRDIGPYITAKVYQYSVHTP